MMSFPHTRPHLVYSSGAENLKNRLARALDITSGSLEQAVGLLQRQTARDLPLNAHPLDVHGRKIDNLAKRILTHFIEKTKQTNI